MTIKRARKKITFKSILWTSEIVMKPEGQVWRHYGFARKPFDLFLIITKGLYRSNSIVRRKNIMFEGRYEK